MSTSESCIVSVCTKITSQSCQLECTATIWQDRMIDLPWDFKDARKVGQAAWSDLDLSREAVRLVSVICQATGIPILCLERWEVAA